MYVALPSRLPTQLWLAVIVDYSGNVGLLAVMKYVDALVVAAACLIGPVLAMLEGLLMGVEALPGPWTIVGAAIIVAGGAMIVKQAQRQSTTVDLGVQIPQSPAVRAR